MSFVYHNHMDPLAECPWCNERPTVERRGIDAETEIRIACKNRKCHIQPAMPWRKVFHRNGSVIYNVQSLMAHYWNQCAFWNEIKEKQACQAKSGSKSTARS